MSAMLLLAVAALGLIAGVGLMASAATPLALSLSKGRSSSRNSNQGRSSTSSAQTDQGTASTYRRRITGAMLVGASLFLGGFTLAARNPIF